MTPRGFTLIEMVVALAVLAVMGAIAFGLLSRLGGEARQLRESLDRTAELRALFRHLDQDISAMAGQPIVGEGPLHGQAQRREGQDLDEMDLVRLVPSRPDAPFPFAAVAYSAVQDTDGTLRVTRAVRPLLSLRPDSAAATLIRGVRNFRIRYLSPGGEWRDGWGLSADGLPALPRGIRAEVVLEQGVTWHRVFAVAVGRSG